MTTRRKRKVIVSGTCSVGSCSADSCAEYGCRRPRELPPEIQAQVKANAADQRLRARIRAEIRGAVAAWGLSKDEAGELLGDMGILLRAEAEADRRLARGRR